MKFHIEDSLLMDHLNQSYGIHAESLQFIPMGDSAYSYQVNGRNGQKYYLKLFDQQNERHRTSIQRLDNYLPLTWKMYHQNLFPTVTYPLKNLKGEFKASFNGVTTVLFNFIEGETLAEAYPFSSQIVQDIAQSAAGIHLITPHIDPSTVMNETFDISFESDLVQCINVLEHNVIFDNQIKQSLRGHILSKKEHIFSLLHLVRELRQVAIRASNEKVLCHGDIWGGNLIRHANDLYFIDWESAIIAPREFDMIGYIGEEFEVFLPAYEEHFGQFVTVNLDVIRFYAYRHHLRNLTNWLMNILYRNIEQAQNENDLEMILHHCMNRWDQIEPKVKAAGEFLNKRPVSQ
ncbi:phosphotransferase [Paenibacillus solisilvae]|uniref:Phosphotransferase n=1 Tax=Paenibacillus solisilvae TaxID=2486751 RepID=A0ABW0W950_9BACL